MTDLYGQLLILGALPVGSPPNYGHFVFKRQLCCRPAKSVATQHMTAPLRSLNSGRDEYETRLRELFDESDECDKGHLNAEEVQALCSRLQLGRLRDKVVRSLRDRSVEKDKVQYQEFRHVFFALLEELEAQQNKSPRKQTPPNTNEDRPDQSPKAAPKLVLGRKKYGRRSLPITEDFGATPVTKGQDQQQTSPPEGSYSQFLRDLDTNDRSSPSVDKRRRYSGILGVTVDSESSMSSAGTILSRVQAQSIALWPDVRLKSLRSPCCGLATYKNQNQLGRLICPIFCDPGILNSS
ncbi:ninein-like protein [Plakobranchus ocellatus]|uniref:Ninein-like protein n=1 Tax=Plakobranchus ocellatus TaxID=259542 RepID=A0AAV4CU90_9GAST|nr:ninein-like protein [Plakobranchus ocellatus]